MSAPVFAVVILSLSAPAIWAGSATWNGNPVDNQWYNPNNWTPATVPDGATDIATFGSTTQPAITISDSSDLLTVLNGITFNPGASAYILTVPATGQDLTFQGRGVVNNSGRTQTFVINGRSNSTVCNFSGRDGREQRELCHGSHVWGVATVPYFQRVGERRQCFIHLHRRARNF